MLTGPARLTQKQKVNSTKWQSLELHSIRGKSTLKLDVYNTLYAYKNIKICQYLQNYLVIIFNQDLDCGFFMGKSQS